MGHIFQDSIYVAVFRDSNVLFLGSEAEAGVAGGEAPAEEGAAFDGALEPLLSGGSCFQIEEHLDEVVLLAGELANLQFAGVGGGLPIDVAGAFGGFIGADAVEVGAASLEVRFHVALEGVEQVLETGLGIDGGIDEDLAVEADMHAALGESEREARGELILAVAVEAALAEVDRGESFQGRAAGDEGEVDAGGGLFLIARGELNGEGRHPFFRVEELNTGGEAAAGEDVLRQEEFDFEAGEGEAADEAGDEHGGEHGGEKEKEEVVGGGEGGEADEEDESGESESAPGDLMADAGLPAAEPLPGYVEWVVAVHLLTSCHREGRGEACPPERRPLMTQ